MHGINHSVTILEKVLDENTMNEIYCKIDSMRSELSQNTMDRLFDSIKTVYIDAASIK